MLRTVLKLTLLAAIAAILTAPARAEEKFRRLPVKVYRDKMKGGWLGQMAGVGWGAADRVQVEGGDHPRGQDAALEPGHGQPARQRRPATSR